MPIDVGQRDKGKKSLKENLSGFVKKNKGKGYSKEELGTEFPESVKHDYLDEVIDELIKSNFLKEFTQKNIKHYRYNPERDLDHVGISVGKREN